MEHSTKSEERPRAINVVRRMDIQEVSRWVVACPVCSHPNEFELHPAENGATHLHCTHCEVISRLG